MRGFLKFGAVSGAGFGVDLILALVLFEVFGLPLWLAATISFFAVAVMNYLLFEFWVFRRAETGASLRRAVGVLAASGVAALARIGTILVMTGPVTGLFGEGRPQAVVLLVAGAGVSLVLNYIINRSLVFQEVREERERST